MWPVEWHVVVSKKDSARPCGMLGIFGTRSQGEVSRGGLHPGLFSCSPREVRLFLPCGRRLSAWTAKIHRASSTERLRGTTSPEPRATTHPRALPRGEGNYHRRGCASKSSRSFRSFLPDFSSTAWCAGP